MSDDVSIKVHSMDSHGGYRRSNKSGIIAKLRVLSTFVEQSYAERMQMSPLDDSHCLTVEDLWNETMKRIKQVSLITGLGPTTVRLLLKQFHWNARHLLEEFHAYQIYGKTKFVDLFLGFKVCEMTLKATFNDRECSICLSSENEEKFLALNCKHEYCSNCWSRYVHSQVEDYNVFVIKCPAHKCETIIDDDAVFHVLCNEEAKHGYRLQMIRSLIESDPSLRWCPNPHCDRIIQVLSSYPCVAECNCKSEFCLSCGEVWHAFVPCDLYKKWMERYEDVDHKETMSFIRMYTKKCPGCGYAIEKNGGCNHITCTKCVTHFCWICGKRMEYNALFPLYLQCTCHFKPFNETRVANDDPVECNIDFQRFIFFSTRFTRQTNSLRSDEKLMKAVQIPDDPTFENLLFVDAMTALCKTRKTLSLSNIFAYYLKSSEETKIFDHNRLELEVAAEKLSEFLRKIVNRCFQDRTEILDAYTNCKSKRENLLNHIQEGYKYDWWKFKT